MNSPRHPAAPPAIRAPRSLPTLAATACNSVLLAVLLACSLSALAQPIALADPVTEAWFTDPDIQDPAYEGGAIQGTEASEGYSRGISGPSLASSGKFTIHLQTGFTDSAFRVTYSDGTTDNVKTTLALDLKVEPSAPTCDGDGFVSTGALVYGTKQIDASATRRIPPANTITREAHQAISLVPANWPVRIRYAGDGSARVLEVSALIQACRGIPYAETDLYQLEYPGLGGMMDTWIRLPGPFNYCHPDFDRYTNGPPPRFSYSGIDNVPGCLSGRVTTVAPGLAPLSGAAVSFGKVPSTTDADGRFSFSKIPASTYLLEIRRPGYQTYTAPIEIPAFKISTLEIPLARVPKILNVTLNPSVVGDTLARHHTKQFEAAGQRLTRLVLRRGGSFLLDVTYIRDRSETITLLAEELVGSDKASIPISVLAKDATWLQSGWAARPIATTDGATGAQTTRFEVSIPITESAGKLRLSARIASASGAADASQLMADRELVILFDPWDARDGASLRDGWPFSTGNLLAEYLENDEAVMYLRHYQQVCGVDSDHTPIYGQNVVPRIWPLGLHNDVTLDVLLLGLDRLSRSDRSDPRLTARWLCGFTNSDDDDGGILECSWDLDYMSKVKGNLLPGELANTIKMPFEWSSSLEVLVPYLRSGRPVQFGQCWVAAGVLTSLLRTAGIASRPVTAYGAGRDLDGSGTLHLYFRSGSGEPTLPTSTAEMECPDGYWATYHVWTEAWLTTPGEPPGWHALDPSPQRTPLSTQACPGKRFAVIGPARVEAIREAGTDSHSYDLALMLAVAGGKSQYHEIPAAGGDTRSMSGPPRGFEPGLAVPGSGRGIADPIITKPARFINAGNIMTDWDTITYVSQERRRSTSASLQTAGPQQFLEIGLSVDPVIQPGVPTTINLRLTNNSQAPKRGDVHVQVHAIAYDGSVLEGLDVVKEGFLLRPQESQTLSRLLDERRVLDWLPHAEAIRIRATAGTDSGDSVTASAQSTLQVSGLSMSAPNGIPTDTVQEYPCALIWTNLTSATVTNLSLVLRATLPLTIDSAHELRWTPPPVVPGGVVRQPVTLRSAGLGQGYIYATLMSPQLGRADIATALTVGTAPTLKMDLVGKELRVQFNSELGHSYQLEFLNGQTADWVAIGPPVAGSLHCAGGRPHLLALLGSRRDGNRHGGT